MITYITTLAYIFGTLSIIVLVGRFVAACTYSESDKLRDILNGVERSFPIVWPTIIAIICWVWIFTF